MTGTMYPASEVNTWLIEQRDRLRGAQMALRAQEQTPEVHDELMRIEGALAAVETSYGYFGKMWVG